MKASKLAKTLVKYREIRALARGKGSWIIAYYQQKSCKEKGVDLNKFGTGKANQKEFARVPCVSCVPSLLRRQNDLQMGPQRPAT